MDNTEADNILTGHREGMSCSPFFIPNISYSSREL